LFSVSDDATSIVMQQTVSLPQAGRKSSPAFLSALRPLGVKSFDFRHTEIRIFA
jgi:hypothetical protein